MSEINNQTQTEVVTEEQIETSETAVQETQSLVQEKAITAFDALKSTARKIKFIDDWFNLSAFQRKKKLKKASKIAALTLLWACGLIAMYICLSNLYQQSFNPSGYTGFFGTGQAVVASNSMDYESYTLNGEKQINTNPIKKSDWIFYQSATADDVNPGDIIIYKKTDADSNETLIVHRLIEKRDGELIAQGDRNLMPDAPFPESDLVGKYVFKINGFGAVLNLLSTPWLFALIFITVLAFIGGKILWYYLHKRAILNAISTSTDNKSAIDRFFDL